MTHEPRVTKLTKITMKINPVILLQSSPLVWSTDVRSTRLYGQSLVGPEQNGLFISVKERLKVKNARLYGQNLGLF